MAGSAPNAGDQGRQNIAFISLLRAVASLMVVWCHLGYAWHARQQTEFGPLTVITQYVTQPLAIIQHGGFLGVAIFFFVSGFIITHVAQREDQITFLVKRLLRIYPPLAASIVVIGLLAIAQERLTGQPGEQSGFTVGDYLRAMTLWNFFSVPQIVVNAVAWTLVVEVVFYLLCLLTLPLMRVAPQAATWLLAGVCWAGVLRSHDFGLRFNTLSVCFGLIPLLLIGQATYWVWSGRAKFWQFALVAAACYFVFVCGLGGVFAIFFPAGNSYGVSAAYAYLLFLVALALNDRLCLPRWIEFYSTISYSLYLLHLPVGFFVLTFLVPRIGYAWAIVPTMVIVTLVSYASWRLVEDPSQKIARRLLKRAPGRPAPRANWAYATAVAAVFVATSICFVLLGPPRHRPISSLLMPATLATATVAAASATPAATAAPPPQAPAQSLAQSPTVPAAADDPVQPAALSREPVTTPRTPPDTLRGNVELVDRDVISGWAWDQARPSKPVEVAIYIDGRYSGKATADKPRKDLQRAGIGNGRHAYLIRSPDVLKDGKRHSVSVRFADYDAELPGSPTQAP